MAGNPSKDAIKQGFLTGVQNNGKAGAVRLEIDDFAQQPVRLNLYLLALEALQDNSNLKDPWCWWQIQGIHGVPHSAWDNIGLDSVFTFYQSHGLLPDWHDFSDLSLINQTGLLSNTSLKPPSQGDAKSGFCTHGSILFPTWHRCYEAMIEQAIQAKMVDIAKQFPAKKPIRRQSQLAAVNFRQPYWDWSRARAGVLTPTSSTLGPGLSLLLYVKQVRVRRPATPDTLTTIPNPLYSYVFPTPQQFLAQGLITSIPTPPAPPVPQLLDDFIVGLKRTLRYPPGKKRDGAISNGAQAQVGIGPGDGATTNQNKGGINSLRELAYHTLMIPQDYASFSNNFFTSAQKLAKGDSTDQVDPNIPNPRNITSSRPKTATQYSIEGWHNTMHDVLGGEGGSMFSPSYAAFDPIFIFHHANVDRHFALWQALWPTVPPTVGQFWFNSANKAATTINTFTQRTGTVESDITPLAPFRKSRSTPLLVGGDVLWDSAGVQNHDVFGYQYEGIPTSADVPTRMAAATAEINTKYAWFVAPAGKTAAPFSTPSGKDAAILNPAQIDGKKVEAFTEFPPKLDESLVPIDINSFFSVPTTPTVVTRQIVRPKTGQQPIPAERQLAESEDKATEEGGESPGSPSPTRNQPPPADPSFSKAAPSDPQAPSTDSPSTPPSDFNYVFAPRHMLDPSALKVRTWHFSFQSLRHGLHTSYTLFLWLGNFPTDSNDWMKDYHCTRNLVAPLHNFVVHNPDAFEPHPPGDDPQRRHRLVPKKDMHGVKHRGCANCDQQAQSGALLGDSAALTSALLEYLVSGETVPSADEIAEGEPAGVALLSLEPEHVIPFLKRNLHFRVLRSDGEEIAREQVPGLKAYVGDTVMTLPRRAEEKPVYEAHTVRYDVMAGRPGGLADGEIP